MWLSKKCDFTQTCMYLLNAVMEVMFSLLTDMFSLLALCLLCSTAWAQRKYLLPSLNRLPPDPPPPHCTHNQVMTTSTCSESGSQRQMSAGSVGVTLSKWRRGNELWKWVLMRVAMETGDACPTCDLSVSQISRIGTLSRSPWAAPPEPGLPPLERVASPQSECGSGTTTLSLGTQTWNTVACLAELI